MTKRAGAPPTIIDVARHAGVSIKTVSRVLNKEPTVHPETRAAVLEVVASLNYRPQLSARSLAGARSFLVGLLYSEPCPDVVGEVQRGATLRCRQADRHLVVESFQGNDAEMPQQLDHMLAALRPDGLIIAPPLCDDPRVQALMATHRTPCVLLGPTAGSRGLPQVRMDDGQAGEDLARLLVGLGHARIAFLGDARPAGERRRHGFERGLRLHDLPADPGSLVVDRADFESGADAGARLLQRPRPPTAVVAATDELALGVLAAAQRLGIAVPRQLSIAGFDDKRAATLVRPSLTTVRAPITAMAMAAVDMLLSGDLPSGAVDDPQVQVLPHDLVVRGSTASLARHGVAAVGRLRV